MEFTWSGSGAPEIYLSEHDYINLLSNEVAFGKKLKVFHFLLAEIAEDPEKYKHWMEDPRYNTGIYKEWFQQLADAL